MAVHGVQIAGPNTGGRRRRKKKEIRKCRVIVIANNRLNVSGRKERISTVIAMMKKPITFRAPAGM